MKLYTLEAHVLSKDKNSIIGRWRITCKDGFYFDTRDSNIKHGTIPALEMSLRDKYQQDGQRFNDAWKAFFLAVCRFFYIDKIVEWLNKRLNE